MFNLARVADIPSYDDATWQDRRPGLAIEDRDLYAEARNWDGCAAAWGAAMIKMYPGKSLGN